MIESQARALVAEWRAEARRRDEEAGEYWYPNVEEAKAATLRIAAARLEALLNEDSSTGGEGSRPGT